MNRVSARGNRYKQFLINYVDCSHLPHACMDGRLVQPARVEWQVGGSGLEGRGKDGQSELIKATGKYYGMT